MSNDFISSLTGYNPRPDLQAGSSGLPPEEEEMGLYQSRYDPEMLKYRLAEAGRMGEVTPMRGLGGGSRRERAVAGLVGAGEGIAGWFGAREGERQEKSAMSDLMAYREIKTNFKKELKGKIDKEFNKLYDTNTLNDKQAILNLRKYIYNGRLSFGNDPEITGILNNMDKSIDSFLSEQTTEQEAGWKEREVAVKESPEAAKPVSTIDRIVEKVATHGIESLTAGEKTIYDREAKTEKLPITLDQQINRVKDAIELIAPVDWHGSRQVPDTKKDPVGAKRYEELIKTYNRLLSKAVSEVEEQQTLPDLTISQTGVESDDEIIADELRRARKPVTPENIQRIKALLEGK